MVTTLSLEMPVSAVARIVQIHEDSVWRLLRHYVDETKKCLDLSDLNVLIASRKLCKLKDTSPRTFP